MTAVAWRTSAGTAAKLPIAMATNLTRTLRDWAEAGLMIVGLDADGDVDVDGLELATGPLVVVVGSEGRGLGPSGQGDVRPDGVDPDGHGRRVAQRVRRRRCGAGRDRAPSPDRHQVLLTPTDPAVTQRAFIRRR